MGNAAVIVPKANGDDIRLCIDMRRANEAIIRERHPIPTVDEVLQSMNGSTVFSKLDLRWGYHQLELTPESREITMFATHAGLYRYKRLLFGVNSASEQYQYEISTALAGIAGADNISDDIIVHGPDQETHNQRLHKVLERLKECHLTLNAEKCQFNMNKLVFMGILLTDKGIGPTEERVKALAQAREPENVAEVRSFLGLANYSSRFIPQFATLSEPLRRLTKKDVPFVFGAEQKRSFRALKKSLSDTGTLAYFDKNAPTKVIADASPVGLGAVLVQEQGGEQVAVCYASRSLTDCERRYSQTEKEALALVWACEKFHAYVYGMKFDLVTDHKPLEAIYGPRSKPCARIERWVLRMQPYDFHVVHIPGTQNIADPLSRLIDGKAGPPEHKHEAEMYVRFVAFNATPRAMNTREVEEASATDDELHKVRTAIKTGCFDDCKPYAPIAGELCVIGQLVLRGTRVILPSKLRPRALALAHEGHLGIVGTKQKLRTKVWWPGMDKAADRHCRSCHGCQMVARPDPPEPLKPTPLPDGPWRDLAVDLMGPLPSGHHLLVVVDYYSRYYEVVVLQTTTAGKVIDCLDEVFSRHGLPVSLKSDNGPQFASEEFREYCKENNIVHCKVTARWAQANGEVERQNASLLKRTRDWRKEMRKYLTSYRSIEHPITEKSPAELLFARKMRGKLPDVTTNHVPDVAVRDRDAEQKGKANMYADARRGAQYSNVNVGDKVLVRQDKINKLTTTFGATPFTVVNKTGNSLVIESPEGVQYSRNTTHVRKYLSDMDAAAREESDSKDVGETIRGGSTSREVEVVETPVNVDPPNAATPTQLSPQVEPRETRPRRATRMPKKYEDFVT